jgi:hypothetical protein
VQYRERSANTVPLQLRLLALLRRASEAGGIVAPMLWRLCQRVWQLSMDPANARVSAGDLRFWAAEERVAEARAFWSRPGRSTVDFYMLHSGCEVDGFKLGGLEPRLIQRLQQGAAELRGADVDIGSSYSVAQLEAALGSGDAAGALRSLLRRLLIWSKYYAEAQGNSAAPGSVSAHSRHVHKSAVCVDVVPSARSIVHLLGVVLAGPVCRCAGALCSCCNS